MSISFRFDLADILADPANIVDDSANSVDDSGGPVIVYTVSELARQWEITAWT